MADYNNPEALNEIRQHNEEYLKYINFEEKNKGRGGEDFVGHVNASKRGDRRRQSVIVPSFKADNDLSNLFMTNIVNPAMKASNIRDGKVELNSINSVSQDWVGVVSSQKPYRRYYTELFKNEEEFSHIFKKLEEDCLDQLRQADLLAEECQSLDNMERKLVENLEKDFEGVQASLTEVNQIRDELRGQLEIKRSQLNSSKNKSQSVPTELTESEKQQIYSKIFAIALDIGLADKKDQKPNEISYEAAMNYLKDLTYRAELFIESQNAFREEDKRGFERETREYQSEKRDRLRYESEIAKEILREEDAKLKKEKQDRLDRERGGRRKDMVRNFIQKEETGRDEKEKMEEEIAKDRVYFTDE